MQLLYGAGRAEHIAIWSHQNGWSIDRLQPSLLFGRVIIHDDDLTARKVLNGFSR